MSTCFAQITPAADLTILNPCLGVLDVKEAAALTVRLEREAELADETVAVAAAASSPDKLAIQIPVFRCEDGPKKVSAKLH